MKNRNLQHKDDWMTPISFIKEIEEKYDIKFDFDPCPFQHDLSLFDGLKIEWGNCNFVNPPYSLHLKTKFVEKAVFESKKGKKSVLLLPVSTSTKLFHEIILPNAKDIKFIKGRIKFSGYNTDGKWVDNKCGMHDSMLVFV